MSAAKQSQSFIQSHSPLHLVFHHLFHWPLYMKTKNRPNQPHGKVVSPGHLAITGFEQRHHSEYNKQGCVVHAGLRAKYDTVSQLFFNMCICSIHKLIFDKFFILLYFILSVLSHHQPVYATHL